MCLSQLASQQRCCGVLCLGSALAAHAAHCSLHNLLNPAGVPEQAVREGVGAGALTCVLVQELPIL